MRVHLALARLLLATGLAMWLSACGGDGCRDGVGPECPLADVEGVWTGRGADNSGPGSGTLILSQDHENVTGTFITIGDATQFVVTGTVTGTVQGNAFHGGLDANVAGCVITVAFTATLDESSMSASYSGTNSCTGPITNGRFDLTRQGRQELAVSGGTSSVRDYSTNTTVIYGTAVIFDPVTPAGEISSLEIRGPATWNDGRPYSCAPPWGVAGMASTRAMCEPADTSNGTYTSILPVTGEYLAEATVPGRKLKARFVIDARVGITAPQITSLQVSSADVTIGWFAPIAGSTLVLFSHDDRVLRQAVVGNPGQTTFTGVTVTPGRSARGVVVSLSHDLKTPGPISGQFNYAADIRWWEWLSVSGAGTGTGAVTSLPAGITCTIDASASGGDCSELYSAFPYYDTVTLTAVPAPGSTFGGWGGACSGTGACVVTTFSSQEVTAIFFR